MSRRQVSGVRCQASGGRPSRVPRGPGIVWGLLVVVVSLVASFVGVPHAVAAFDVEVHGFVDGRAGTRLQEDPVEKDTSLAEIRAQLELLRRGEMADMLLRVDALYDDIPGERDMDLEAGTGWVDLREANVVLFPVDFMDIKVGRQILTWGTGDLLFINDLFPKDWQAFFSGRDTDYLKAPSDALLVSLFPGFANIDIVYTPRFDPDRYISGDRLSYWNPGLGRLAGEDAVADPLLPETWFEDDELSIRVSWTLRAFEAAVYGYHGFWKSPAGMDPVAGQPNFPVLTVSGASLRGPVGKGILSLETGYYDSSDDRDGDDPLVPNREARALVGYEWELARNLTVAFQGYVEHMLDHDAYCASLPTGMAERDENRQVTTLRIVRRALGQNLVLSLFGYYSPTDEDYYVRPIASYKVTDSWLLTAGANLFGGEAEDTFFGQFENNSNVYAGTRVSF